MPTHSSCNLPFCFCLIAFQAIQTPGCPLTFKKGWPSPRFQQARQHCPEPWGHNALANRGGLSMPAGPEGSMTREELEDASTAMRAPGVCLPSGAQLRHVTPSSLSSSSLCNGSDCPVPAPPVHSRTTDSPWFHRFSAGEEFCLKMNRTSHLI